MCKKYAPLLQGLSQAGGSHRICKSPPPATRLPSQEQWGKASAACWEWSAPGTKIAAWSPPGEGQLQRGRFSLSADHFFCFRSTQFSKIQGYW
jgi:hypothetical protein